MVASFQNPAWMDLGVLGSFGRWIGVNWIWAVELTIYHAIVSITIHGLLVELIYLGDKTNPWIFGHWRKILSILFSGDVVVGFFSLQFTGFIPPISQYVFFIVLSGLFQYLAYRLPSDFVRRGNQAMRKPRFYFLVTFLGSIASGCVFGVLPEKLGFTRAPVLVFILGIVIVFGVLRTLTSYDWKTSSPLHITTD